MVKATVVITKELSVGALNEELEKLQQQKNIKILSVSNVRISGFFDTQYEYLVTYEEGKDKDGDM